MRLLLLMACIGATLGGCGCENEPRSTAVAEPKPALGRTVPLSQYDRAKITVGGHKIDVFIADEQAERTEGLMFVKAGELKRNEGMIFVFSTTEKLSFWMENTLIPLDIAFLDDAGKIINIREMEPFDRSPQPSEAPARYAVEMNQGWFKENGVNKGAKFDLSAVLK